VVWPSLSSVAFLAWIPTKFRYGNEQFVHADRALAQLRVIGGLRECAIVIRFVAR